jgi:hypothetical protein
MLLYPLFISPLFFDFCPGRRRSEVWVEAGGIRDGSLDHRALPSGFAYLTSNG